MTYTKILMASYNFIFIIRAELTGLTIRISPEAANPTSHLPAEIVR